MLALTDIMEVEFIVSSLAKKFSNLGNLDCSFIVNHKDVWYGRKTWSRFRPLFGAKIECIVEKSNSGWWPLWQRSMRPYTYVSNSGAASIRA